MVHIYFIPKTLSFIKIYLRINKKNSNFFAGHGLLYLKEGNQYGSSQEKWVVIVFKFSPIAPPFIVRLSHFRFCSYPGLSKTSIFGFLIAAAET